MDPWSGGSGVHQHPGSPGIASLARRSAARSRAVTAENPTGEPGQGGRATTGTGAYAAEDLGRGWKVSPSVEVPAGQTTVLADITGPGVIHHLWLTCAHHAWRTTLLRITWEEAALPAVQIPLGDFFCQGWAIFSQVSSAMVAVNPSGGLNCYWPMPFRRRARIELVNLSDATVTLYYQVDYELTEVADEDLWFHARWRRSNPVPRGQVHTVLTGEHGAGHYVGTYLAWGSNSPGWWGEGEMKFFLDDDEEFPTICGTGTEDYVGGAWNFDVPGQGYTTYTTPYLGLHQVIGPDGLYSSQQRFGMYRWHVPDPVRFSSRLAVTVQALGFGRPRADGQPLRYRQLSDDVSSTAFVYLDRPGAGDRSDVPAPSLAELDVT